MLACGVRRGHSQLDAARLLCAFTAYHKRNLGDLLWFTDTPKAGTGIPQRSLHHGLFNPEENPWEAESLLAFEASLPSVPRWNLAEIEGLVTDYW